MLQVWKLIFAALVAWFVVTNVGCTAADKMAIAAGNSMNNVAAAIAAKAEYDAVNATVSGNATNPEIVVGYRVDNQVYYRLGNFAGQFNINAQGKGSGPLSESQQDRIFESLTPIEVRILDALREAQRQQAGG